MNGRFSSGNARVDVNFTINRKAVSLAAGGAEEADVVGDLCIFFVEDDKVARTVFATATTGFSWIGYTGKADRCKELACYFVAAKCLFKFGIYILSLCPLVQDNTFSVLLKRRMISIHYIPATRLQFFSNAYYLLPCHCLLYTSPSPRD